MLWEIRAYSLLWVMRIYIIKRNSHYSKKPLSSLLKVDFGGGNPKSYESLAVATVDPAFGVQGVGTIMAASTA